MTPTTPMPTLEERDFHINGIELQLLLIACKEQHKILLYQLEAMQKRNMAAEATNQLVERYKTLIKRLEELGA
jgi:hypothetical protein